MHISYIRYSCYDEVLHLHLSICSDSPALGFWNSVLRWRCLIMPINLSFSFIIFLSQFFSLYVSLFLSHSLPIAPFKYAKCWRTWYTLTDTLTHAYLCVLLFITVSDQHSSQTSTSLTSCQLKSHLWSWNPSTPPGRHKSFKLDASYSLGLGRWFSETQL